MSTILGIDPGPTRSAIVELTDGAVTCRDDQSNDWVLGYLRAVLTSTRVAIENIEPRYGVPVGWETLDTARWVGRFQQAATPADVTLLKRSDILRHFGIAPKANADSGIRACLMDRFGGAASVRKGGPLYGIVTHRWAALSVAVCYQETHTGGGSDV